MADNTEDIATLSNAIDDFGQYLVTSNVDTQALSVRDLADVAFALYRGEPRVYTLQDMFDITWAMIPDTVQVPEQPSTNTGTFSNVIISDPENLAFTTFQGSNYDPPFSLLELLEYSLGLIDKYELQYLQTYQSTCPLVPPQLYGPDLIAKSYVAASCAFLAWVHGVPTGRPIQDIGSYPCPMSPTSSTVLYCTRHLTAVSPPNPKEMNSLSRFPSMKSLSRETRAPSVLLCHESLGVCADFSVVFLRRVPLGAKHRRNLRVPTGISRKNACGRTQGNQKSRCLTPSGTEGDGLVEHTHYNP